MHPALGQALARRGYETATEVQAAVLDPAVAGQDLLVSSQTGSGKTVAFGTLIADGLLAPAVAEADAAPRARARGGHPPRALVVAPTRELATQVARELEWLFADAGTRVASFTGGTSVSGDLRRLKASVDLAVGTPGRLVDLHRRQALDLSSVTVLVLDEADEMLDLGFKEDLEYLLGNAPAQRRTLLFSATLPREIERMAATYLRDPMRVDPRRAKGAAAPPTGAHADIRHVAHLVRPQDRLAAVVNVVLGHAGKAIVFCRTREGVGELHQRLVDHGLSAAAISGERAQGERDRALEALRSGRARVLVATNVAARGLDLPDVDLVVHADLPENADALTHRSGRTGRAGKKGTSVVIADRAERRKAERLLSAGRVTASWTPPPTADEVRLSLQEKLVATLLEAGSKGTAQGVDMVVDRLRASLPERVLVSLLLAREVERLPVAMPLVPVDPGPRERGPAPPVRQRPGTGPERRPAHAGGKEVSGDGAPGRRRAPAGEGRGAPWFRAVIFRVNLGAEAKAEPGWLLPLICRRGGVTRREVGAIRVGPRSSTFEIAADAAGDFALAARQPDPRAPDVIIEPVRQEGPAPRHQVKPKPKRAG